MLGICAEVPVLSHNDSITVANCKEWPKDREFPRPRKNTLLEELLAIFSMLACLG